MFRLLFVALMSALTTATFSAQKTVTLSVPTMDCAACPITVKKALQQVGGVSQASVNFDQRQASVTFDDTKTTVQALTQATRNAGYPSTVAESSK